jgi:hypothetical protein
MDAARREQIGERGNDRLTPVLTAGRQELANEVVAVAVDDEAGQPVRFAEYQAAGTALVEQAELPPQPDGGRQPPAKECFVDCLALVKGPGTQPDLRDRRVRTPGQELAGMRNEANRRTRLGLTVDRLDRAREYPRMATAQRLVAPGLECDEVCLLQRPYSRGFEAESTVHETRGLAGVGVLPVLLDLHLPLPLESHPFCGCQTDSEMTDPMF